MMTMKAALAIAMLSLGGITLNAQPVSRVATGQRLEGPWLVSFAVDIAPGVTAPPQFSLIVFKELAPFGDEQLFLFGTTTFVSELSETAITSQQVNVPRIENLAVWSAELFCGIRKTTK